MIELLTASTPNGWKASIALEEMGLPYTVTPIRLGKGDQKQEGFLKLNPNGRIPVIVDHDADDFVVFESGAILIYLADKSGKLLARETKARSVAIQWLMFQMGGLGPMMGQANVFNRYAPEKLPWAIGRYQRESSRLLAVLDRRLGETGAYLVGDEYTIADIANFSWARAHEWAGADVTGLTYLHRWMETIAERPAVKRGLVVPEKLTIEEADPEKVASEVQTFLV